MNPSDEELCSQWMGGDQRAGATLVKRHFASVDRFFRFKVGEPHGPDLTQKTFLAVQVCVVEEKRTVSSFRPWLFGIARNKLLHHFRDDGRHRERIDFDASSVFDLDPSPSTIYSAGRRHRLLLAALQRLPLNVQLMLELHYWEEMTLAEIADVVEKPVSTVKIQIWRGRKRLFELMEVLAESQEDLETTRGGLEDWAERVRRECDDEDGDDDT
jgi:RNA polymerase sigma factor (sigma-70 family)